METLMAINALEFTAGLVLRHNRVVETAKALKYMRGWDGERVMAYCKWKGWNFIATELETP
jgi:hypothetical protein